MMIPLLLIGLLTVSGAALAAPRAVAITLAPAAFAIWIAVTPMPLFPPCTRKTSPACSRPRSNTLIHTVKKVSGRDAASMSESPAGTGRHCSTGATHQSA